MYLIFAVHYLINLLNFHTMTNVIIKNQEANITPSTDLAANADPVKKVRTARTIRRADLNKDIRVKLLNFTQVFKQVRADYLQLPNRVKISHIQESVKFLNSFFADYCRENLSTKMADNFYLERLPVLTTDIKSLKCFLTKKQIENFAARTWSAADIVDTLVKACTMSSQDYNACLAQKGKI